MSILSALKKKFNAKGNNIEEAIKTMEVGGGYEYDSSKTILYENDNLECKNKVNDYYGSNVILSKDDLTANSIIVIFNGEEYHVDKITRKDDDGNVRSIYYGAPFAGDCNFFYYPFSISQYVVSPYDDFAILVENSGTYSIKIIADNSTVNTGKDFEQSVKKANPLGNPLIVHLTKQLPTIDSGVYEFYYDVDFSTIENAIINEGRTVELRDASFTPHGCEVYRLLSFYGNQVYSHGSLSMVTFIGNFSNTSVGYRIITISKSYWGIATMKDVTVSQS